MNPIKELKMKKLVIATALAVTMVAPAFAQSTSYPSSQYQGARAQALPQQAPQQRIEPRGRHSSNPSYDVFVGSDYKGSDPDPRIRNELRREEQTTE
jgi:hypothetical protein